jgi:23S rRNA A1618 N6-methylase RlmF
MANNPITNLTIQQLKRALALKEQIERLENELARVLGNPPAATTSAAARRGRPRKKRTMSEAARARIAAGQKARWAKIRRSRSKAGAGSAGKVGSKRRGKRTMSAAAKARIAASQRARWARIKAAGGGR